MAVVVSAKAVSGFFKYGRSWVAILIAVNSNTLYCGFICHSAAAQTILTEMKNKLKIGTSWLTRCLNYSTKCARVK